MVVFATYSYSFGTGIYALSLCRNFSDFNGYFCGPGADNARELVDAGPANEGNGMNGMVEDGTFSGKCVVPPDSDDGGG